MQSATPSSNDIERGLLLSVADSLQTMAPTGAGDSALDLLGNCVEAMSLLQAKFKGLEVEVQIKLDLALREVEQLKTTLGETEAAVADGNNRLDEADLRAAQLERSLVEAARQHADDIGAARAEAATWRMRGETDAMAFDHLMTRISKVEEGLVAKLAAAEAEATEQQAEAERQRRRADAATSLTDRLQGRLRDVEAIIADQRSRISTLQTKLATAAYAQRIEQLADEAMAFEPERDILDLKPMAQAALVSAA